MKPCLKSLDVRVAVVGAGPGGLAAVDLTHPGSPLHGWRGGPGEGEVLVIDDAPAPGGQIWRGRRLKLPDHVQHLPQTQIVDAIPRTDKHRSPPILLAASPDGPVRVVAKAIVLATGAMERFLPFPGWTLPGVVGAGGLQALIKGGFDVRGRRVVVAGTGPLLLAVADLARRAGSRVACVAEQADRRSLLPFARAVLTRPSKLAQGAGLATRLLGVAKHYGTWPTRAEGDGRVERVVLRSADGSTQTVDCDLLACGFGLVPRVALPRLLGCDVEPTVDGALRVVVDERQQTSVPGVSAVGEATGVGGVDKAIAEGRVAARAVAGTRLDSQPGAKILAARDRELAFADALATSFALRPELRQLPTDDTLVCRCEDVPWRQLSTAASARDAKLTTRCGMGPCQARVCGPALAFLKGWPPESPRPPLFPTDLQTLADLYGAEHD